MGKFCLLLVILFSAIVPVYSQSQPADSLPPVQNEPNQIQLNTYVDKSEVPLNRPVIFHVQLSWTGNLNRYQIEPVSLPVLTNLLLEGSGSENRLEPLANGNFKATKSITYRFKPLEMGMAYIDGVTIRYTDRRSGEENQLTSQRVMVEISEPVAEPGEGPYRSVAYVVLLIIFFTVIAYFMVKYFRKRREARRSPEPVLPAAELFLNRLAQEVDPRGTNLGEMTAKLSRIFREYLQEAFHIQARESSTREILEQLQTVELDESDRKNLTTVFEKLDLIKFAGKNVDPTDFTRIYGAIEAFLIKRKQMAQQSQVEVKEEK